MLDTHDARNQSMPWKAILITTGLLVTIGVLAWTGISNTSHISTKETMRRGSYFPSRHLRRQSTVQCQVVHGPNNFNAETVLNFSGFTNLRLVSPPHLANSGVYAPGKLSSEVITAATDRSRQMATNCGFVIGVGLVDSCSAKVGNTPITKVDVLFAGSTDNSVRIKPTSFENSQPGGYYRSFGSPDKVTVGQWESTSGKIRVSCDGDGQATMSFELCNAVPKSVYSVWEVGCTDCLESNERPFVVPAGGLPNLILTDMNGIGRLEWKQPNCPTKAGFVAGGTSTLFYSIAFHLDFAPDGGSVALNRFTPPALNGYVINAHLACSFVAPPLIEPQNDFRQCMRYRKRRRHHYDEDDR